MAVLEVDLNDINDTIKDISKYKIEVDNEVKVMDKRVSNIFNAAYEGWGGSDAEDFQTRWDTFANIENKSSSFGKFSDALLKYYNYLRYVKKMYEDLIEDCQREANNVFN